MLSPKVYIGCPSLHHSRRLRTNRPTVHPDDSFRHHDTQIWKIRPTPGSHTLQPWRVGWASRTCARRQTNGSETVTNPKPKRASHASHAPRRPPHRRPPNRRPPNRRPHRRLRDVRRTRPCRRWRPLRHPKPPRGSSYPTHDRPGLSRMGWVPTQRERCRRPTRLVSGRVNRCFRRPERTLKSRWRLSIGGCRVTPSPRLHAFETRPSTHRSENSPLRSYENTGR